MKYDKAHLRTKLVRLLPRGLLEELSGVERPWHAERKYLELRTLNAWDDHTMDEILKLINRAR